MDSTIADYRKQIQKTREENNLTKEQLPDLTDEEIMDEIVADYTMQFLEDTQMFKDFISKSKEHKKLGQRMIDALKALIAKIKKNLSRSGIRDDYISKVEKALQLWEQAYQSGQDIVEISPAQKSTGDRTVKRSISGTEDIILQRDVQAVQSIGRKSVNDFTSKDIQATEVFAKQYNREMGTKSPFFRAWFGDWRAYDINRVTFSDVTEAKEYKAGKTINSDIGRVISWGSDFIRETRKHQRSGGIASKIVGHIKEIINNAVLLDSYVSTPSSKTKMPGTVFMHSFYSMVNDGNVIALVKLYAEEAVSLKSGKPFTRAYNLKDIAIVATSANGVLPITGSLTDANIATINNVSDLFSTVKRLDEYFNPKDVNPILLNDDGTPKIFYHGTNEKFTVFSPDELSPKEGSFFFAENREDAQAYGDNIYEVYLQSEKLANYDNQPSEFYRLRDKRNQVRWLKERGYDGWYADIDSGGWGEISVFSNTQVKSAIDNIGTFDRNNPDINYSIEGTESIVSENLEKARKQHGEIPKGENPARDVRVPRKSSEGQNVSYTIRTALEAGVTPDVLVPKIEEKVIQGDFSDETHANKKTLAKAKEWLEGFESTEKAHQAWSRAVKDGSYLNEETTVRGFMLYNQLATEIIK